MKAKLLGCFKLAARADAGAACWPAELEAFFLAFPPWRSRFPAARSGQGRAVCWRGGANP
jgi:hypothetical protein